MLKVPAQSFLISPLHDPVTHSYTDSRLFRSKGRKIGQEKQREEMNHKQAGYTPKAVLRALTHT